MIAQIKDTIASIMKWLAEIERHELKATALSFLFVFILMFAYYLLRPVRDAMASDWTDVEVSWLWTMNFVISTILVALYGFVVSRVSFKRFVTSIYLFFALTFVLFFVVSQSSENQVLVDKAYYLWVSVFSLFHLSVFWGFMADIFNKTQASRLFGIITAGASAGSVCGAVFSGKFAPILGIESMMLIAALLLLLPIPIILALGRLKDTDLGNSQHSIDSSKLKIGNNPIGGFVDFFTNPYLMGVGLFLILYTGIGSFVYFEQKNLLAGFDIKTRASIYGYRDAIVSVLTYFLAFFVTGRLVTKLGMPSALAMVPIILIFGMLILSFSPVLLAAVAMHISLKAGNYGLTRPAREMLFTVVDREALLKAKPVVDIVAYRGGDVIMGWLFSFLSTGIGLGMAAIALVGALISGLWAIVGYLLGKSFDKIESNSESADD